MPFCVVAHRHKVAAGCCYLGDIEEVMVVGFVDIAAEVDWDTLEIGSLGIVSSSQF